ncbi:MAG: peroxiredoxin-like family protein [Gemmatimonadales bacterium]
MMQAVLVVAALTQVAACADRPEGADSAVQTPDFALRPEDVKPISNGSAAPTATLRAPDGATVDLAQAYGRAPTVLIFYRGGWCPFCSAHLGKIATIQDSLAGLGVQVLAVSPDRPEKLRESAEGQSLQYQLLSDSDMALTKAFGLAFRMTDEDVAKYAAAGLDLAEASGHDHHLLPVPAVYLIDTTGMIRFAHWDPDYRKRIATDSLLQAVRSMR